MELGAERVVSLALTASQKKSDEVEGVNQASTDQVRLLWRLWGQISENDKLEQHSLDALEQRMISIEEVVTTARNMHTKVKNDHVAAMSYLRRILKSRQKNKEAKAAFQSELEKTTMQVGGPRENSSKKRVASSPPDDSIESARKLSVGGNRKVIIRKERLNSAPTSTFQRDRNPSPDKTEIVRKQKRKGKSKKGNPVPTRGKTASGKTTSRRKLPRPKAEAVLITATGDNKMSYDHMLKELKTKASPDDVGSKVVKIRKIRDGNLLIELPKDSMLGEVSGAIRQAVGNQMLVRPMVPTVPIELRDLEETTTEEEIREAFITALVEATPDQVEVKALRAGPRGTKVVLVVVPIAIATAKVLKPGKVGVGWVNATAREKKLVIRCFKCLEFGNVAAECLKAVLHLKILKKSNSFY